MSKQKWIRCPVTDLPISQIPDKYLTHAGAFDTRSYSDCNLFEMRSIAAAAGYQDWRYFRDVVVTGTHSHFHFYQVHDNNGRLVTVATRTTSAEHGGKVHRAETLAAQKNIRLTDVSSGSSR